MKTKKNSKKKKEEKEEKDKETQPKGKGRDEKESEEIVRVNVGGKEFITLRYVSNLTAKFKTFLNLSLTVCGYVCVCAICFADQHFVDLRVVFSKLCLVVGIEPLKIHKVATLLIGNQREQSKSSFARVSALCPSGIAMANPLLSLSLSLSIF